LTLAGRTSRAEALAARLPPLLVEAERVAETVRQGVHGRRRVGVGESFWQFRPYTAGDARIDWRQSAKSDRVYVRETEWEAAQTVFLWRDPSESMAWTAETSRPTKRLRAELLSLALAALLLKGGERVALPGMSAVGGRGALERLGRVLLTDSAPMPSQPLPRHSSLVLIGDFLDPLDELAATLQAQAARGIFGAIVQLLDPAEVALPWEGRVRFRGLEGEGDELVPRVGAVREAYQEAFALQTQALERTARAAGFVLVRHTTDKAPQEALLALHAAMRGERT
jgi:uncharacterized protein (DUF58 family)